MRFAIAVAVGWAFILLGEVTEWLWCSAVAFVWLAAVVLVWAWNVVRRQWARR